MNDELPTREEVNAMMALVAYCRNNGIPVGSEAETNFPTAEELTPLMAKNGEQDNSGLEMEWFR